MSSHAIAAIHSITGGPFSVALGITDRFTIVIIVAPANIGMVGAGIVVRSVLVQDTAEALTEALTEVIDAADVKLKSKLI
jgi:hypothetical protein